MKKEKNLEVRDQEYRFPVSFLIKLFIVASPFTILLPYF